MSIYDKDIDENPYLSQHGKYAVQFARNHNITVQEAYQHPMVKAHAEYVQGSSQLHKGGD